MPNFSWVGDATNVDGWLGGQSFNNHAVYEYVDIQAQSPAGLYGGAPVYDPDSLYGNVHTDDQSESQADTSIGPMKKKKKHGRKTKKATSKLTEDKTEKAGTHEMTFVDGQLQNGLAREAQFEMEGGQIEKQLQDLHIKDAKFGRNLVSTTVSVMDVKTAI